MLHGVCRLRFSFCLWGLSHQVVSFRGTVGSRGRVQSRGNQNTRRSRTHDVQVFSPTRAGLEGCSTLLFLRRAVGCRPTFTVVRPCHRCSFKGREGSPIPMYQRGGLGGGLWLVSLRQTQYTPDCRVLLCFASHRGVNVQDGLAPMQWG